MAFFLKRHRELTVKIIVSLDSAGHGSMNPEKIANHFATFDGLMNKYNIHDPTRIFNIDESGFFFAWHDGWPVEVCRSPRREREHP